MPRAILILGLIALLAGCSAPQTVTPAGPAVTLAPGATPLVTQVGAGAAQPANHFESIRQAGVIRVGTSADYPPFEFLDAGGARLGFDIELMDEIAGRLGVRVEWVDLAFNDLIGALQAGKIDAAISAFEKTGERDALVDFSRAYYTPEDAFVAAPGFSGVINTPQDAAAYSVGVLAGSAQETWLRENLVQAGAMTEASLRIYEQKDAAVADLLSGTLQLFMLDKLPAQAVVEANEGLVVVYSGAVSGAPVHIAVPDGDAALTQAIDAVIQQLESEEFIKNLAIRYISASQ